MVYPALINQYPITSHLDEICDTLKASNNRFLILTAETGAGKSTVLPVGLLKHFEGKILMTEPRRLAALGVAERVSELLGEECGKTSGYKVHLDSCISKDTRLEVVTEAVLIRQLQSDPALEDYNLVVLDEFHERSIYTDMALAFLQEAMELREDLFVVIMSATMDSERLQHHLGNAPVLNIPGRTFKVEMSYKGNCSVTSAVLEEIKEKGTGDFSGNILVFLPGIADIRRAEEELRSQLPENVELCILHSSIKLEEQKYILKPAPKGIRRVILSSSIAETSLTVPGVTSVIDSGLARVNRLNIATGMNNLVTETESEFSAVQRAGRAGRLMEGRCVRLWFENEARIRDFPPEILRSDLTELVLECAERGVYEIEKLNWLDAPKTAAWNSCKSFLKTINCLDLQGHITEKGREVLKLSLPVRLASIVLEAGEKDSEAWKKIVIKYGNYKNSDFSLQKKFVDDIQRRKKQSFSNGFSGSLLILAGFPDRIARRISEPGAQTNEYQFCGGRKAIVSQQSGKNNFPLWICAPEVMAGERSGVIFDFEALDDTEAENWLMAHSEKKINCRFENGRLCKEELTVYGELVMKSKKLEVSEEDFARAWAGEVREKGLSILNLDERTEKFLIRVKFYEERELGMNGSFAPPAGELQTNVSFATPAPASDLELRLQQKPEEWLIPFMNGPKQPSAQQVYDALYWYLKGDEIDRAVPEVLSLENGRRCKVKYEKLASPDDKNKLVIRPVIEIIIQRAFGCFTTPVICGMKVLLRLLSPANRPLQVTDDLENFWTGSWVEICKEMKGRYPKHNWDYRIAEKDKD